MIVVSDTSPIMNLIAIGQAGLLPALFGDIILPPEVERELRRTHGALPGFLVVRFPTDVAEVQRLAATLDQGEAEAITLAVEIHADRLLMDEKRGRAVATQAGLRVIGLLGVLVAARKRGLLPSVRIAIQELEEKTTFYLSAELKAEVFQAAGETILND